MYKKQKREPKAPFKDLKGVCVVHKEFVFNSKAIKGLTVNCKQISYTKAYSLSKCESPPNEVETNLLSF